MKNIENQAEGINFLDIDKKKRIMRQIKRGKYE